LERIHSHLLWLGVLTKHIGLDTIFMHTWHDRELVLDLMENLSGGRVSHGVNQIGGVRFDISEPQERLVKQTLEKLQIQVGKLIHIVEVESSIKARTQGVAVITPEQIKKYCMVGPVARASGIDIDLRRDVPMAPYSQLPFNVITHTDGDAWARTYVRIQEVEESLQLCRNIMEKLPDGPVSVKTRRKVPPGETTMRLEAPRGEVFYYLRSDGTEYPARLKIRTPTLPALSVLTEQLTQIQVADISVVLAGVDLCIACADR
jgi:NADH-quinone oxidoreductase subunit D